MNLPELPPGYDEVRFMAEVGKQLAKDFQIEGQTSAIMSEFSDWMLGELTAHPERLHASFYRLDLSEEVMKEAFSISPISECAVFLAKTSIERAALKVMLRITFKLKNTPQSGEDT